MINTSSYLTLRFLETLNYAIHNVSSLWKCWATPYHYTTASPTNIPPQPTSSLASPILKSATPHTVWLFHMGAQPQNSRRLKRWSRNSAWSTDGQWGSPLWTAGVLLLMLLGSSRPGYWEKCHHYPGHGKEVQRLKWKWNTGMSVWKNWHPYMLENSAELNQCFLNTFYGWELTKCWGMGWFSKYVGTVWMCLRKMRNPHKGTEELRGTYGAWVLLTIGVHVISRHLGWSETLSEGVSVVDTLFDGQQLLWGGHSCVGVHDPFHSSSPTTICLSCGTKKEDSIFNLYPSTPQKTALPDVQCSWFSWHGSLLPPQQVTQENPSQKAACYSSYLICHLTILFMYTMYS